MKIFESELRGKTVMSDDGTYLGILRNTTVAPKSGDLASILVEASEDVDPRLYTRDPHGFLVFPFGSVRAVRDVVIIQTT